MKNRTLETVRFGIEIEVEFPTTKDSYKLIEKHRIIQGWWMTCDGTLENGAEYKPKDRNKLYYTSDCKDQIKEILGLIKAHKGTIKPTCGLHIHVDMSKFTNQEIINIIRAFIKHQNLLYRTFKTLKTRQRDTAAKIPKVIGELITEKIIQDTKEGTMVDKEDYFDSKYYGLNIQSLTDYGTIEFRFFNGSIQSRTILKNIKWAIEFCIKEALSHEKR